MFTLAALLAVFLQAFVVEPHVHVANPLSAAIAAGTGSHDHAQQHATLPHEQTSCLVCQALAAGGGTLLTRTVDLVEPSALAILAPSQPLHVADRTRTHSWQSRAPPISL